MNRAAMYLLATLCLLLSGCDSATGSDGLRALAVEPDYRPQYHFTAPTNWLNDPNGLVYYQGEYHLFYQYNPEGSTWGHMNWGHAVSRDLVRWEHLPVALREEDGWMMFSGSVVVDWQNTSGFGKDGEPPMVALYTGHRTRDNRQVQAVAYSTDRGRTWTKYGGNPVIDIGSTDFRDPKVFWYEPGQTWVMVVALSQERKVRFYSSPDLKQWTYLSDFGQLGSVWGVWECPDLFPLAVDGDPQNVRWVLEVDVSGGGPTGGSAGQYFLGRFDGTTFTLDGSAEPRWVDYGADFYASLSWSDIPRDDGRRVMLGWMNNQWYANAIPTSPFRGSMSIPRVLGLGSTPGGIRLVQQPAAELQSLRGTPVRVEGLELESRSVPLAERGVAGRAMEIIAEFEVGTATEVGLQVRQGGNEETLVGVNVAGSQLFVDRTRSGSTGFHPGFAARHAGPLTVRDGRVRLHVFVDWSSVEVFGGEGETVLTDQIFPTGVNDGVSVYARGGRARLVSLEAWPLSGAGIQAPSGN
ncbi:glycoside hydrolase family 32 protein [Longimicrobium terrae]|uniref:Fructan beta-fructosidase n=1 Tax=Longimicrobium terrae TaxID=1639882 RepID=A0A841GV79_9BACT|nr:glycoside hydrolase family 32 protein [Longimicrobium terrae]MBB4634505.1 fructan beta-fructosidase [Longimicrobium terrae]MBB6068605.1 fructan beta-fructosidase [Longimicrobium terrae]NNC27791.1 glycoside hydrolase family 32 protein [Longimicrobium terrae]